MPGQNASLNVVFTSSGAGSVIGDAEAVSAALSGIKGGTVSVGYESKGASGAVSEARSFDQAMKSGRSSAADLGRETQRAAQSAAGLGKEARNARAHMQGLRDDVRSMYEAVGSVGSSMGLSAGASEARREVQGASRAVGQLHSEAGRASEQIRAIGAGAQESHEQVAKLAATMKSAASFAVTSSGRIGSDAGVASRLPRGDQTGTRASNFAVDASGQSSSRLSGANKEMELFGQRTDGVSSAISSSGKEMERFRSSSAGAGKAIEAFNTRVMGGAGSSAGMGAGPRSGWSSSSFEYTQGGKEAQAGNEARKARKEAQSGSGGAPWARKAAEDIDEVGKSSERTKSKSLDLGSAFGKVSNAGWQMAAVAGAMAGVTSEAASMTKSTAGLGMSLDGMNAMLTRTEQVSARGAIGGQLSAQDSQLRQSARTMTSELTPAIKSSIGAVGAMENAKMGAWGSLGPQISQFANTVKSSAPGLQSMMTSIGSAALNMASDVVSGVSQTGPGWQQFEQTVANNGPALAAGAKDVSDVIAGVGQLGVWAGAAADTVFKGVDLSSGVRGAAEKQSQGSRNPGTSHGFDPSRPFSGTAISADGTEMTGTGTGSKSEAVKAGGPAPSAAQKQMFAPGYKPPAPHRDDARYSGMSASQIYESQFRDATGGYPSTGPYPSGLGAPPPRTGGPGASAGGRAISPAIGAATGAGGPVLSDMMSAASKQVGSSSSGTSQALQQHITKAVHSAAPAASAGGAQVGAAIGSGVAQGVTSTQTVTDTVMIKHAKRLIEVSSGALGIHSPSREFDYLGRMTMAGFGQGLERQATSSFGQLDGVLSAHQAQASKYASTYGGAEPGVTVTVPKPNQAMQYSSQSANQNIDAHNERASRMAAGREQRQRWAIGGNVSHDERRDQLLQNRANNHERALANLGVGGRARPSDDVNPFAGDQAAAASRKSGLNSVANPFSRLPGMLKQAGQNSGKSLAQGMTAHVSSVQAAGGALAGAGHAGYKKKDKQASPSAEWAAIGGNSVAGIPIGFSAGVPAAVSAMSAAAQSMSMALQGQLSDYGLQAGYTYVQAFADGSSRELKKSDTQALGMPDNLSPGAMQNLATGGFLRAGSGASTWKTNSGGNGVVTLGGAQSITVNVPGQDVVIGDQVIASIADRQIELMLNAATGTYDTL